MTLFWKSAAVLGLAIASVGGTSAPAQAQSYGYGYGYGYGDRDGWRGGNWDRNRHDRRWDNRRWNHRTAWRKHRGGYDRGYRGYRQRCWTEWRYDYYRDRDVRVRICR